MRAYRKLYDSKDLSNTEKFSKGIFSLPLYPQLKMNKVVQIAKILRKILLNFK